MNARGAEFIVQVDRVVLGHVCGEHKGKNSVGDSSFDGMNPHDLSANDQMQPFANVANGFFLEGHGLAVEGEPKREHPIVGFFGHYVSNGSKLDQPDAVFVQNGNGGRSFEENRGRMVIFLGSERNFLQEERERAGRRDKGGFFLLLCHERMVRWES